MNYVSTRRILEKSGDYYSTKKFAHRMYPLAEIDVIGRWGRDSPKVKWDLTGVDKEYLGTVKKELKNYFPEDE
jgi:hypothetical protein